MVKCRLLRYAIPLMLIILLGFTFATPAFACQDSFPPPEEGIDGSQYVFIGTVMNTVIADDKSMTVQIAVERYLQGNGLAVVYLTGFYDYDHDPYEFCSTDSAISVGQRWVFFANGEGETLQSYAADRNRHKVYFAFDDFPDRVVSAYIHDPLRPLYQLRRGIEQWKRRYPVFSMLLLLSFGLAGVFGIGFAIKR
jgi:hypothetical protein